MKHVVITGGTRGIGFGLAREFLKNNCKVSICGTSDKSVSKALEKLSNDNIGGFVCDVSNYNAVNEFHDKAVKHRGTIDIWINNAGINQPYEKPWDITYQEIETIVKTNINGLIFGTQIAYNAMKQTGKGQIYNMEGFGSDGRIGDKMTLYGTTKRAIRYFTRSFARENKNNNILIATLSPGMVVTDFFNFNNLKDEKTKENIIKIYNILADNEETVTKFLVKQILNNRSKKHIAWLTGVKVMWRFISSPFRKRNLFN